MSDRTWVSSANYAGPGKWEEVAKGRADTEARKAPEKPSKPRKVSAPVVTLKVDPRVLKEALRLAEGDASRLSIQQDGTIIVGNASKRRGSEHP